MKTLIVQVNYNRLRGIKPNNELAYYDIDGQPLCQHTYDGFNPENISFYTLVDKTLKTKYNGPVNTIKKDEFGTVIPSLIEQENPNKLIVLDDTIILNKNLIHGIESCNTLGAVCDIFNPIERGYLGSVLRDGQIRNITYGLTQKGVNILPFGNVYVFGSTEVNNLYETYLNPKFKNYALFEIINNWIDFGKTVLAITGTTHRLVSIRNQQDLNKIKEIISENSVSFK